MGLLLLVLGLLAGCGGGSGGATGSGGSQSGAISARTDSTNQVSSTVVNVTVPLQAGWNGVGFRSQQIVLGLAPAEIGGLAYYDGTAYQTRSFNAVEINSGAGGRRGFWVFASQATSFTYSGQDTGPNFVDLIKGWNLVSFATDRDIPGSSVTVTKNGQTVPLQSVVLPTFIEIQPPRTYANVDVATGTLRPGLAYWVYAAEPVRLILPASGANPGPSPSPSSSPVAQVVSITVTPANSSLQVLQTGQFTATGRLADGSSTNVTNQATWSSDAPSIASSLGNGQFKALNPGSCNITATLGGSSGSTRLTVTDNAPPSATPSPVNPDTQTINFEPPTYAVGSVNGQDGWSSTGTNDHGVVANTFGFASFGQQLLRISNAVSTGGFDDQVLSRALINGVGESTATAGGFPVGMRRNHFEVELDVATTVPTLQPGLVLSLSPYRGDSSRMSFLRLSDTAPGVLVEFYDVQGTTSPANFVATTVGTISRGTPHRLKLTMDTLEGPSNDVVKVFIDGTLVHTGTSWENYFRYDAEALPENTPRVVTRLLVRASGTAAPGTVGQGFLFDNLTLSGTNN